MARRLVLGLGLAAGVVLSVVGCETKSSTQTAKPPSPDAYEKSMGKQQPPREGDKGADDKDAAKSAPKGTQK